MSVPTIASDETKWVDDKARRILVAGVDIQAPSETTNRTIEGLVRALVDHIDNLDADLNCAIAVGRYAAKTAGVGQAADPWQPIATAPKDGTLVLCFVPHDMPYQVVARWFGRQLGVEWWSDEFSSAEFTPTHWQPLPAAPSLQRQEPGE